MSTKYFILSKDNNKNINNDDNNQIIFLNSNQNFILPYNLMNYYISNGLFEKNLIEWSKQFCSIDKITLDIGAHTGTYSLYLSKYSKEVHSFEPQKMTFYSLCGSVALSNINNIICHKYGLGSLEQKGNMTLNIISNDGGGSSIHNVGNILNTEIIEIKTLDDFNLENIGFIKMDVENNEYYVILGGLETLKKSNYPHILFEINNKEIGIKVFELLYSLGYNVINILGCNNMHLAKYK